MENRTKIYEGKAKILYEGDDPKTVIQYFKDDATAGNGEKTGSFKDKGYLNNLISSHIMKLAKTETFVPNHFIARLNDREQLVKKLDIVQLEVVVRNYATGSFIKRMPFKEGDILQGFDEETGEISPSLPLVEFFYKNDSYNDPMVSEGHILHFDWLIDEEILYVRDYASEMNRFLFALFKDIDITFVDAKFEFGRNYKGRITLADDICPDGMRLWDNRKKKTDGKIISLDKDLFRKGLGGETDAYYEVAKRLKLV